MVSTKRIITWVKWHNPYKLLQRSKNQSDNDDGYDKNSHIALEDEDDDEEEDSHGSSTLVFLSPLGPVPLNEHNDPDKTFNFWVGHTNFNVSKNIKDIISATDGVEILNIHTRYRFRIAVAKMFCHKEVTRTINRRISKYFRDREEKQNEDDKQESTSGINEHTS